MQVRIAKWGNSLGLRVPHDIAARLGLTEGARVDVEASDDGRIIVTRSRRRFTLDELLAGMTAGLGRTFLIIGLVVGLILIVLGYRAM